MSENQTVRDAIGKAKGWRRLPDDRVGQVWLRPDGREMHAGNSGTNIHPIPNTLDSAAAAMPEGWSWERKDGEWEAWPLEGGTPIKIHDTGNELADRFALALKALESHP